MSDPITMFAMNKGRSAQAASPARAILVIGQSADVLAQTFRKALADHSVDHAVLPEPAKLRLMARRYSQVLIDARHGEDYAALADIALRQTRDAIVVVLAERANVGRLAEDYPGAVVLGDHVGGSAIWRALHLDRRETVRQEPPVHQAVANTAVLETAQASAEARPETVAADAGQPDSEHAFTPATPAETVGKAAWWAANILPRLTPVYSLLYKNLALTILAALFLAFVSFGIMIAFFLTSSKWSAPITLSKGHELVSRIEKDMGEMRVKANQLDEQLDDARTAESAANAKLDSAMQLAGMVEGTIKAEIHNRTAIRDELASHIKALKKVSKQYGGTSLGRESADLNAAYKSRIINRTTFEAGKLSALEGAHRIALLDNEIATNEAEVDRLQVTITALNALAGNVAKDAMPTASEGGADLVPLLNQVMEVRRSIAETRDELANARKRDELLNDSRRLVLASIRELEQTPLARAAGQPITVLFVPYENASEYAEGKPLYACAIGIFWCHNAGSVGHAIPGETVGTHPFFNKPIRGFFVEAHLDDPEAAKKEILHVSRAPLFF